MSFCVSALSKVASRCDCNRSLAYGNSTCSEVQAHTGWANGIGRRPGIICNNMGKQDSWLHKNTTVRAPARGPQKACLDAPVIRAFREASPAVFALLSVMPGKIQDVCNISSLTGDAFLTCHNHARVPGGLLLNPAVACPTLFLSAVPGSEKIRSCTVLRPLAQISLPVFDAQ